MARKQTRRPSPRSLNRQAREVARGGGEQAEAEQQSEKKPEPQKSTAPKRSGGRP